MFGFIKKLIAGILSFVTGFLSKQNSNNYYLELKDDTTEVKPVAPVASNGTKVAVSAEAPSSPETSAAPTPVQAAQETSPATTPAKVKAPKNSHNGKTATAPVEPVAAPVAKAKPVTPTETTFAPKYLAPSATGSNGRRRPGANMSSFLDMARQVKTPG